MYPARDGPARRRACGWVAHHIDGEALPQPLCMQRLVEGCFVALAGPTEIAAHVPRSYWQLPRDGASAAPSSGLPTYSLGDGARGRESDGLDALLALASRIGERRGGAPLVLLDAPPPAVSAMRVLHDREAFGATRAAHMAPPASWSPLLSGAWRKCTRNLLDRPHCAAVC